MPWENRFDVKTASQCAAYRQLIAKEAMRRRNDPAILSRYHFRDEVTGPLSRTSPHWNQRVVEPSTGQLAAIQDIASEVAVRATSIARCKSAAPRAGGRSSIVETHSRSTVLNEGYVVPASSEYLSQFDRQGAAGTQSFAALNPDLNRRRQSRTALKLNQALDVDRQSQHRFASVRLAAHGLHVGPSLPVAEAPIEAAIGDVAPVARVIDVTNAPSRFGLKSFGVSRRPLSAAALGELRNQARMAFAAPPPPAHVEHARSLLDADAMPIDLVPSFGRPASAARSFERLDRDQKLEKLRSLENELLETMSQRDAIGAELRDICAFVESRLAPPDAAVVRR